MYNMFNKNAEHGKLLCQFPSLLGSRSQLILNGGRCMRSGDRENQRGLCNLKQSEAMEYQNIDNVRYS